MQEIDLSVNQYNTNYLAVNMSNIIIERLDRSNPSDISEVGNGLLNFMDFHLRKYYPHFRQWYTNKVISGFLNGTRTIFISRSVAQRDIKGIVILKQSSK